MKLTVGQLTAQHVGMHIRVGEYADGTGWMQDGQLWAVMQKEEAPTAANSTPASRARCATWPNP